MAMLPPPPNPGSTKCPVWLKVTRTNAQPQPASKAPTVIDQMSPSQASRDSQTTPLNSHISGQRVNVAVNPQPQTLQQCDEAIDPQIKPTTSGTIGQHEHTNTRQRAKPIVVTIINSN